MAVLQILLISLSIQAQELEPLKKTNLAKVARPPAELIDIRSSIDGNKKTTRIAQDPARSQRKFERLKLSNPEKIARDPSELIGLRHAIIGE